MIAALKHRRRRIETATSLCAAVSRHARDPVFYREYGVADSIDGRFDLLTLHAWLVLERLQTTGETDLAQAFVDGLFARFDEALREQGAGDIGVGRRMKTLAGAFYGRLSAYSATSGAEDFAAVVLRDVYRGDPSRVDRAGLLAKYMLAAREIFAGCNLASGELQFPPFPRADVRS
jgi:cytochrome b pre-mRNA-processing protein 3